MAPLQLPAELRALWETVAIGTSRGLRVEPYPRLTSPEFALESWNMLRIEREEDVPPNLAVLVGYESHGCMSIELDMDGVQGGALFDWFISSPGGFTRRYNHLHEWLDHITTVVERGAYKRSEQDDGTWLVLLDDAEPLAAPHPQYDSPRVNDGEWPRHWIEAAAIFDR